MRTFLTFAALLFGFGLYAQSYFPETGSWSRKYHSIAWGHGGEIIWDYSTYNTFSLQDDTVANGKTFRILADNNLPFGYILTENEKVYFGKKTDSLHLMFDFGLLPGDTFVFHAPAYSNGILHSKVIAVDSVLVKSEFRKRIQFSEFPGNGAPEWIAGIGDVSFGGIEPDYSYVSWMGNSTTLICFEQGGVNIFGTCTLGVDDISASVKVWPNPVTDYFCILIPESANKIPFTLSEISGRALMRGYFKSGNNSLDAGSLLSGVYLLAFQIEKQEFTYKIIKL